MKRKPIVRKTCAARSRKNGVEMGGTSNESDNDDAVLVVRTFTGKKRPMRPVENESVNKKKRKKKYTRSKAGNEKTSSQLSKAKTNLRNADSRDDKMLHMATSENHENDFEEDTDEIEPWKQPCEEVDGKYDRSKDEEEKAIQDEEEIFVIESDEEVTDSSTSIAFKYKYFHGKSRTVTHQDLKSIKSQPASFVTIDALLWLCTESLRRYYDRGSRLFVYNLTLVHSLIASGTISLHLQRFRVPKPFWDDIFGHEVTLLVPLHSYFHYSLAVVEAIDSATQCFRSGNCTCPTPSRHIKILHYDGMGQKSSHKSHIVFKAVTDWLYMGAKKFGFPISLASFADHFVVQRMEECDGDQRPGDLTCSVFTALYGASVICGSSFSSERGKVNTVVETIVTKLKDKAQIETRKYADMDIPHPTRSLQPENYYRLPLEDLQQYMSTADIMQIANWKIDDCLRDMWDIQGLHYLSRPVRRKKNLKVDFRERHKDSVRKGAKLAAKRQERRSGVPKHVMNMAMGSLWSAADCSYSLAGKDLSERIFIAMRSYPDSHINYRAPGLLFVTHTVRKIGLKQTDKTRTAPTLHTNLRQLLVIYGVDVRNHVKLAPKLSPEARTTMQEISLHIVAVVEYVLQCTNVALEKSTTEFEIKENLQSLLQEVPIADQCVVAHKKARKALRTNLAHPERENGLEVYKLMEAALKISKEVMSACGKTIVSEWRKFVLNEDENEQTVRTKNEPVQPSFLVQFPRSLFTELYRALWSELTTRIKNDPGQEVKREILRVCNLRNEIFVSLHDFDKAPAPQELSVFVDRDETAARVGRPPNSSRSLQPTGIRSELPHTLPLYGMLPTLSVARMNRLSLNTRINDKPLHLYALSRNGDSIAVTFSACVFRVLFSVLIGRHMHGRDCVMGCNRGVIQRIDKDIGLLLRTETPGWMTPSGTDLQEYWTRRLQETIVPSCITAASVPNLSCLEPYNCPERTGYGSFGPAAQVRSGGEVEWRGNVLQFITMERIFLRIGIKIIPLVLGRFSFRQEYTEVNLPLQRLIAFFLRISHIK